MASTWEEPMGQNEEDVAEMKVSVTGAEFIEPKKLKNIISRTLQSWANKNGVKGDFTASEISEDGKTAVISVTPAAALLTLHALWGEEFTDREQKTFSLRPFIEKDVIKASLVDQKSSVKSGQNLPNEHPAKSQESSADDISEKCTLALGPYWHMKNLHQDEMQRIERENGVKITENVEVSIKADKKRANPKKALDEFIKLIQSCYDESIGVSIPLKQVGSEEWKETLKSLQMTDGKCQITVSSDQITVYGPQQYQTAIIKSLKRTKTSTDLTEEEGVDDQEKMFSSYGEERKTRNKIKLSSRIEDPLVIDGLPVENYYWEIITNQRLEEYFNIMEKFNVRFNDVDTAPGIKTVKVHHKGAERNVRMESHAIRALLRLYQKEATFQLIQNSTFTDPEDLYSSSDKLKGRAGEMDRTEEKSAKEMREGGAGKKASRAEAKKEEKEEEERCPVCLDSFTNKKKLKCKHEFCKDCLDQSVKTQGAICPVCKDVFGLVEGDQPDGTMRWTKSPSSLPGFEGHGTIEITYDIPSRTQTSDADVADVKVSLWSLEEIEPKTFQRAITKTLQSWANKNGIKGEFTATEISVDGRTAVISVNSAEARQELLSLCGKKLITKEKKTFSLTPIQEEQKHDDEKSSGEYSSLKQQKTSAQWYRGLRSKAYLPDNTEGNEVLLLLKRAFDQRLIFTLRTSRTTGAENVVTWNDIHHKTSTHGGPQSFGYPDPDYLSRVKDELKAKGIM